MLSGVSHARSTSGHLAMLPFQIRAADEPRQVQVSRFVLAEQRQPLRRLALRRNRAESTPMIGLHALRERRAIELHHREQVRLVGERHRRHARLRDRVHQLRHAHQAVDEGVLGMQP